MSIYLNNIKPHLPFLSFLLLEMYWTFALSWNIMQNPFLLKLYFLNIIHKDISQNSTFFQVYIDSYVTSLLPHPTLGA